MPSLIFAALLVAAIAMSTPASAEPTMESECGNIVTEVGRAACNQLGRANTGTNDGTKS